MFKKIYCKNLSLWKIRKKSVKKGKNMKKKMCHLVSNLRLKMSTYFETRPNWARKIREMILFSVLCTVCCGRGCVSLIESEYGKELAESEKE